MTAIRLARGFTGRSLIVKFEGCYHGHADSLLVKAGSGALTFGNPSSAGVPPETAAHTLVLDYNDIPRRSKSFSTKNGKQIACVIVEPVAGNMNLVLPSARLPRSAARELHAARRGADLRRSDDRLSRRARRRAGALRHPARPDHARQGDRRRPAGRRVRRPARHHGEDRAARPGVPGRHAVGQSGRRGRRPGDAEAGGGRRASTRRSKRRRDRWSKA